MFSPANFVSESTKSGLEIPTIPLNIFRAFHTVHSYWRWFRVGKIYSNPDNFVSLAAGHGVNFIFGSSSLLRVAAVCVQLSRQIIDCIEQKKKFEKSWSYLRETWRENDLITTKIHWDIARNGEITSPSTRTWIRIRWQTTSQRVKKVTKVFFKVLKEGFAFSMKICDTIESFSLDFRTSKEGTEQFFFNGGICIDKLTNNKEELIDDLTKNKEFIDKILTSVHSPINAEQLIQTTSTGIKKIEKIKDTFSLPNNIFVELVCEMTKKLTYSALDTVGCAHLMPNGYTPNQLPPWRVREMQQNFKRYPTDDLITCRKAIISGAK